jgi:DNA-binding CsgD family transcriptional regulator
MTIAFTHDEQAVSFKLFQTAMDLVISSSTAQDLCRKLVHSDLFRGIVRGARIYSLDDHCNLIEVAAYGDSFIEGVTELSSGDDNPASKSIQFKQQVFSRLTSPVESAVVALPFMKESIPTGALVLLLTEDIKTTPIPEEIAPALGKLGAYFLETRGFAPDPALSPKAREAIEELTTRQVTILSLMGDGLTNADIGHRVLLSESTVRQETIRIYRALGVTGRMEAVAKARALGLLPKLSFNLPPVSPAA